MLRQKIISLAGAAALALAPVCAFAWNSTADSATPGHQMQEHGSVSGQPGASGYAPGHQTQQFSSRDSVTTPGAGLDQDRSTERSVKTQTDNGNGTTTTRSYESHSTTR